MLNGIILAVAVAVIVCAVIWYDRKRQQRPDDAKLDEWLAFLIKGEPEEPERMPRTVKATLPREAYDAIRGFMNPKLIAEFEEKTLALENSIAARAIQVQKVERRVGSGKPMSEHDLAIMRREGLMGEKKRESKDELLEFTPGKQWGKNEADTDYITDPE